MAKAFQPSKSEKAADGKEANADTQKARLSKSLEQNVSLFQEIFKQDGMLNIRNFENKKLSAAQCCILYIDGMVNIKIINENIIQPVLRDDLSEDIETDDLLEELKRKVIASDEVISETSIDEIVKYILSGYTLFLLEGYDQALIINSKGWQSRSISEPESSKVVRGPREGFTESIVVNLSLVRRKIKDPELKFKYREVGVRTHTKTCICYMENLASVGVLNELEQRLDKIDIDGILDSGYIQELIKDAPYSPFETVGMSERPDVTASKLLEGRVALFVDGSPFVLTVPFICAENFQANEDYYNNYIYSSMNRLIRGFTAVVSITIPAIFQSIVTFHQEMLPTPLLLSISASRQGVPIPTAVSLFLMLFIFDILREVGIRMPTPIGQAVNIVGALVLGQAAIDSKLVSAPVVMVTALTGIMTLVNMNFIGANIIYRNFLLLGASLLGIYGFLMSMIVMYLHLMSLRSFGVPYMMNVTRVKNGNGQDVWIRAPWWIMTLRPKIIGAKNLKRQSDTESKEK